MFFADAVLPQAGYDFSCDLVHDLVISLFTFKVEVRAVIIKHGRIPFYDGIAVQVEPGQIIIVMFFQKIHKPQDVRIAKVRFFIIGIQSARHCVFGERFHDPGINKETVDRVAVKSHFSASRLFFEKIFES